MELPKDPVILLSFINTKLRDTNFNLEQLCMNLEINKDEVVQALGSINYYYDISLNQFK